MASGTIQYVPQIKIRAFNILNGSPAKLTFGANFRGLIVFTGTSSSAINGIMSVASNSTATTVAAYMLASGSSITSSVSGNVLTLSASTTVTCFVISLNNVDLPAIA